MMKMFEVTVEHTVYVVEEDERAAREAAQQYAHEEEPALVYANEITKESSIDPKWKESIPYGKRDQDKTCVQLFKELHPEPPEPYNDPNQMKLPGAE